MSPHTSFNSLNWTFANLFFVLFIDFDWFLSQRWFWFYPSTSLCLQLALICTKGSIECFLFTHSIQSINLKVFFLFHLCLHIIKPLFFFTYLFLSLTLSFLKSLIINISTCFFFIVILKSISNKVEVFFIIRINWIIQPWLFFFVRIKVFCINLTCYIRNERRLHLFDFSPIYILKPWVPLNLFDPIFPESHFFFW